MAEVEIREASKEDAERVVELLVRQLRLNEEFDPLLKVSSSLAEKVRKYIDNTLTSERNLLLVAETSDKIVGVLRAELVDRLFYEPQVEGLLRELYVLPEYRRRQVGRRLIEEAIRRLREKGAGIITAEFPSQHKIAVEFYERLGFRPLMSVYAKET